MIACGAACLSGCSQGVERTVPPAASVSAIAIVSAAARVAPSPNASASAGAQERTPPRFTVEEALALLFPASSSGEGGKTLADLKCTDGDDAKVVRCLIEARYGSDAKGLATMRRDLPLDVRVEDLVSAPPDRAGLAAILDRFEFKNIKARLHLLG